MPVESRCRGSPRTKRPCQLPVLGEAGRSEPLSKANPSRNNRDLHDDCGRNPLRLRRGFDVRNHCRSGNSRIGYRYGLSMYWGRCRNRYPGDSHSQQGFSPDHIAECSLSTPIPACCAAWSICVVFKRVYLSTSLDSHSIWIHHTRRAAN